MSLIQQIFSLASSNHHGMTRQDRLKAIADLCAADTSNTETEGFHAIELADSDRAREVTAVFRPENKLSVKVGDLEITAPHRLRHCDPYDKGPLAGCNAHIVADGRVLAVKALCLRFDMRSAIECEMTYFPRWPVGA